MAMQTVYLKEHEGNVHNPIGRLSSVPSAPWWSQLGSQPVYGATCGQLKSSSMEIPTEEAGQRLDKGNPTQFTLFPDALKLLKDRGTLKKRIDWGGRNMDKKKSKLVGIHYNRCSF